MTDTNPDHYATAGFNEPVTAYMEYRYEKETDWQSMLDNGENLLWYYDKILVWHQEVRPQWVRPCFRQERV